MSKSSQAFRTIREVSDWLDVKAHVLRFWESKFPQIKPVKRAGGRRYYRPADMELVGGIKVLLHERGMTIKGVQDLIRIEGLAHVTALSPPVDLPAENDTPAPELDAWEAELGPRAEAEDAEVPDGEPALPFDAPPSDDGPLQLENPMPEDPAPAGPEPATAAAIEDDAEAAPDEAAPDLPEATDTSGTDDAGADTGVDLDTESDADTDADAESDLSDPESDDLEMPDMSALLVEFAEFTAIIPTLPQEKQDAALPLLERAAALARSMAPPSA